MSATQQLHAIGQSLWLDNITRGMLLSGTLRDYINRFSVTGLTSNPTIFERAIGGSGHYDIPIRQKAGIGLSAEAIFFELAMEDLALAADMFRPTYDATLGRDGWVSLEVSPLLANDSAASVASAVQLHAMAARPNLFIKLPGTGAGIAAIEESIFRGVPVNVTLLFCRDQYLAAARAYMRGIERRLALGLDPRIASVASIFVSRWDVAANDSLPARLRNKLGIAVARQIHASCRMLLASPRWQKLRAAGADEQRLLWASTGTKDPGAPDTLYVEALAVADTINTMPEATLLAFAEHGKVTALMQRDGADTDQMLATIISEGVDIPALATRLQIEGTVAFARSWHDMLACIGKKSGTHLRDDSGIP